MNILRTFNGVDYNIELTPEEIQKAFKEQQHLNDIEAVRKKLDYYEEYPDEFFEAYGCSYFKLYSKIDEIAFDMRDQIDKHNSDQYFALIDAIEKAVRSFW